MSTTVEALILDLLEWIGPGSRPYAEVIAAWRTSCPRLPVWEEANERGLLEERREPGRGASVAVSALGRAVLRDARPADEQRRADRHDDGAHETSAR
jgi:D-3-phosphoglycerate dehydrogenase